MQARLAGQKTLPKFAQPNRDIVVLGDADDEVKALLKTEPMPPYPQPARPTRWGWLIK